MADEYVAPSVGGDAFNCPYPNCRAFAHQLWRVALAQPASGGGIQSPNPEILLSRCSRCGLDAAWVDHRLVHPPVLTAPPAHSDLGEPALSSYNEARAVLNGSARASAALLRLCLEELVGMLGAKNDDLNSAIGELVAYGLSPKIQLAMDALRVIGNDSVHPGDLSVKDDPETALALFDLVNLTVETMISQPKLAEELYGRLPQSKRDAIAKRDESGSGPNP